MSDQGRVKLVAFTITLALVGLLIVVLNTSSLYSPSMFYGMILIIIGLIVAFSGYALVWEHASRYLSNWRLRRRQNHLSRKYFKNFRGLVDRFCEFSEFANVSSGIMSVLNNVAGKSPKKAEKVSVLKDILQSRFDQMLRQPIDKFRRDLWLMSDSDITFQILNHYTKEFENYVRLHKILYVDSVNVIAQIIGDENISKSAKKVYSSYREDYNHFIDLYTDHAKNVDRLLRGIFSENLEKAYEL